MCAVVVTERTSGGSLFEAGGLYRAYTDAAGEP